MEDSCYMLQDILVLQADASEGSCNAISFSVYDNENSNTNGKEKRLLAAGYNDGTVRQYDLRNIYVPSSQKAALQVVNQEIKQPRYCQNAANHIVQLYQLLNMSQHFNDLAKQAVNRSSVKNVLISGSSNI